MGPENLTSVTEFILMGLTSHRKTQMVLFFIILLIYLLTLAGNLVIIILVQANSSLHTPMYFFLTHLSGLEICYVTSTLPQMLAHLLSGNGAISFTRCIIQMYIVLSLGATECLLLGVMAYDRYLAICHPLGYATAMGRWRQMHLASASWVGGFFFAMINVVCTLRFPFCGPNHLNHFFCELPVVMKLACGDIQVTEAILFVVAVLIPLLLIPLSVILTSYGLILSSVLRMQSASVRHKAFSTCASHLTVVTMFYVISLYMKPRSDTTPDSDKQTAVFYVVITPLLNPIIYTLRNKEIHKAAAKMLPRKGLKEKY